MTNISFPNFNINLKISKIAFTIFNIDIYWYAIIIVIAVYICMLLYLLDRQKYGIKNEQIFELTIYLLPISILGARAYYVLFKFEYYMQSPLQILNIRNGGLAIYGALIVGAIVIFVYTKIRKIELLNLLDGFAPYLALRSKYRKTRKFRK